MVNFRKKLPLIIAACVLVCIIGCGQKDRLVMPKQVEKITLAVSSWPASAPLYVAHEKGYFKSEGLDAAIEPYASGHLGLAAVLSGKADIAVAGDTPIVKAVIEDKPLAVIATIAEIDQAVQIIARKDSGISTPADLKGKKIGLAAGTTADFFLHVYMTTSYISPDEVRIVNLTPGRIVDDLLMGKVDAVSTWSPYTITLRNKLGANAVILPDPRFYVVTWNVIATQDFVEKHPEIVKKFLRAVIAANTFITENPAETQKISSKYIGLDSALFKKEWKNYHFDTRLDQSLIVNFEDQTRWMLKKKTDFAGKTPPNYLHYIYTDGLKAVLPESMTIAGK